MNQNENENDAGKQDDSAQNDGIMNLVDNLFKIENAAKNNESTEKNKALMDLLGNDTLLNLAKDYLKNEKIDEDTEKTDSILDLSNKIKDNENSIDMSSVMRMASSFLSNSLLNTSINGADSSEKKSNDGMFAKKESNKEENSLKSKRLRKISEDLLTSLQEQLAKISEELSTMLTHQLEEKFSDFSSSLNGSLEKISSDYSSLLNEQFAKNVSIFRTQ